MHDDIRNDPNIPKEIRKSLIALRSCRAGMEECIKGLYGCFEEIARSHSKVADGIIAREAAEKAAEKARTLLFRKAKIGTVMLGSVILAGYTLHSEIDAARKRQALKERNPQPASHLQKLAASRDNAIPGHAL